MRIFTLVLASAALYNVASAQTVVGLATSAELEAAGLSGTKVEIAGGTVIVDNEAGTFGLAYNDSWGTSAVYKNYRNVKVGDTGEIKLDKGATGTANPKFTSYQDGVMSAGTVFNFEAKKDGWMTVFTRINAGKQYAVFEGETGAVAYTLGVAGDGYKIHYTLPAYTEGENAGMIDFDSPEASKYLAVVSDGQYKPSSPYVAAGLDASPGESTGFLTFKVNAGKTYYFAALGSKAICDGFIYTDGETEPTVTFCANGDLPEVVFEAAPVSTPEEPTFPESFDVTLSADNLDLTQGEDQGVYSIAVSGKTIEKEVTLTVAVPAGWDGYIGMNDVDYTPDFGFGPETRAEEPEFVPVEAMLEAGFKEGNTMTFPVDGEAHVGQFYLCKDGMADMANQISVEFNVEIDGDALKIANSKAYDQVVTSIQVLYKEFYDAFAEAKTEYPDYDFSEWFEIIEGALNQALEGADQAYEAAQDSLEEFFFPFDGEEIEAMIKEMSVAPIMEQNYAAYDLVLAQINDAKANYEYALAFIAEYNPEADITEMKQIIEKALAEAEEGAEQALYAAHEDGAEYFYPFDSEYIDGMIIEMKKIAVAEPNEKAFAEVWIQIEEAQKAFFDALEEIFAVYPDADINEQYGDIKAMIDDTYKAAQQALDAANDYGEAFFFPFSNEDIMAMIEQMKLDADTSGVGSVNAADKATYYDLNGNRINNPKAGTYIKVIEGKATKVVIK